MPLPGIGHILVTSLPRARQFLNYFSGHFCRVRQISEFARPFTSQPKLVHLHPAGLAVLGVHQFGASTSDAQPVCLSLGYALSHVGISSAWCWLYGLAGEFHWLSMLKDDDSSALAVPAGPVADSTAPTTLGAGMTYDTSEWRDVVHAASLMPISPRNSLLTVDAAQPCFFAISGALRPSLRWAIITATSCGPKRGRRPGLPN